MAILDADVIQRLCFDVEKRILSFGQTIAHEDKDATSIFIVQKGDLDIRTTIEGFFNIESRILNLESGTTIEGLLTRLKLKNHGPIPT